MARGSIKGISVEINGDTTKLQKALGDVTRDSRAVEQNLKAVEKALKLDPGNIELVNQKQKLLGEQIENTRVKLDTLRAADESAKKQLANGEIGTEDYEALKREILLTEASLNNLERQSADTAAEQQRLADTAKKAGAGVEDAGKKAKRSGEDIQKMGEGWKKAGDKMSKVGTTMTKTVTAPIVALATAGVHFAAELDALDSQFSQVFGDLEKSATDNLNAIAKETGSLPNRLKPAFTQMAAFGKTAGMDTAESLDLATRATMAAADSAAFYDKSLESTTDSLQSFLKGNYANDAALGISATETTRNAKAMEEFGVKFNDLTEIQKQQTLMAMVEDGNKLSGAVGQAARETDTLSNQLGNLQQAGKDALAEIAAPLIEPTVDALKALAETITGLVDWYQNLDDGQQKIINSLVIVAATVGPAVTAFGKFSTGIGSIIDGVGKAQTAIEGKGGFASTLKSLLGTGGMIALVGGALVALGITAKNLYDDFKIGSDGISELAKTTESAWEAFDAEETALKRSSAAGAELFKELERLNRQTSLTADESARMSEIVTELSLRYPDLNMEIDEQTGLLVGSTDAIKKQIEAIENRLRLQSYEAQWQKELETQTELEEELAAATEKHNEELDKRKSLAGLVDIVTGQLSITSGSYFGTLLDGEKDIERINELLSESSGRQEDVMKKYQEALEANNRYNQGMNDNAAEETARMEELAAVTERTELTRREAYRLSQEVEDEGAKEREALRAARIEEFNETHERLVEAYAREKELREQQKADAAEYYSVLEEKSRDHYNAMGGIADEGIKQTELTAAKIKENLEKQIKDYQNWGTNLETLSSRVPPAVLAQLEALGPGYSSVIGELNNMTDAELSAWVSTWQLKSQLAGKLAEEELRGTPLEFAKIAEETVVQTDIGLGSMPRHVRERVSEAVAAAADEAKKLHDDMLAEGEAGARGLEEGLSTMPETARTTTMAARDRSLYEMGLLADAMRTQGSSGGESYAQGIGSKKKRVEEEARRIRDTALANSKLSLYNEGVNAMDSFASGIKARAHVVATAASNAAASVPKATRNTLQIKSPSRVMRGIGHDTMEGSILGMKDKEKELLKLAGRIGDLTADGLTPELSRMELGMAAPRAAVLASGGETNTSTTNNSESVTINVTAGTVKTELDARRIGQLAYEGYRTARLAKGGLA